MPEFQMMTASLFNLWAEFNQKNLDTELNRDRFVSFLGGRLQVFTVVKVEFLDWRETIQPVRTEHQIKSFADRTLAHIV